MSLALPGDNGRPGAAERVAHLLLLPDHQLAFASRSGTPAVYRAQRFTKEGGLCPTDIFTGEEDLIPLNRRLAQDFGADPGKAFRLRHFGGEASVRVIGATFANRFEVNKNVPIGRFLKGAVDPTLFTSFSLARPTNDGGITQSIVVTDLAHGDRELYWATLEHSRGKKGAMVTLKDKGRVASIEGFVESDGVAQALYESALKMLEDL